jgi:hypothetical protein
VYEIIWVVLQNGITRSRLPIEARTIVVQCPKSKILDFSRSVNKIRSIEELFVFVYSLRRSTQKQVVFNGMSTMYKSSCIIIFSLRWVGEGM